MNVLNLFTKLYSSLHNRKGIPYWVFTPLRRVVRYMANKVLPIYLRNNTRECKSDPNGVIISLTSFPSRINNLWLVIESLKNQSIAPWKIILWLSKDQFPTRKSIPKSLLNEEDDTFEIIMVEGDIRSHKKYYYVMQLYPNRTFVTCDDDVYYHPDMLKHLVTTSELYSGCVVANVARVIAYDKDDNLSPYNQWELCNSEYERNNLIQIGIGGVLYPPHSLHKLTLRKDLFLDLTPMADDIWLNAMARLNGTPIIRSSMKCLQLPLESKSSSLSSVNRGLNRNDEQLLKLRRGFIVMEVKDVYDKSYIVEKSI